MRTESGFGVSLFFAFAFSSPALFPMPLALAPGITNYEGEFWGSTTRDLIYAWTINEVVLTVERLRAAAYKCVATIELQFAGFSVVGHISVEQHISQGTFQLWFSYRCNDLDPVFQISSHPVGAADKDLIIAAVGKPKHTAVLKEAPHNAAYSNVLRQAGNSRAQHTNPSHNQVNLHAGTRDFVKLLDNLQICQAVKLGNDLRWSTCAFVFNLAIKQRVQLFSKIDRRHHQFSIIRLLRKASQVIEQLA